MKRNLATIIATTALSTSLATFVGCADRDYSTCREEVTQATRVIRQAEQRRPEYRTIGTEIHFPLRSDLTEEQQLCIARGISQEMEGIYEISRIIQGDEIEYIATKVK